MAAPITFRAADSNAPNDVMALDDGAPTCARMHSWRPRRLSWLCSRCPISRPEI